MIPWCHCSRKACGPPPDGSHPLQPVLQPQETERQHQLLHQTARDPPHVLHPNIDARWYNTIVVVEERAKGLHVLTCNVTSTDDQLINKYEGYAM